MSVFDDALKRPVSAYREVEETSRASFRDNLRIDNLE